MTEIPAIIEKFGRERIIALDIEHTGGKKADRKIIQLGVVEFGDGKFVRKHAKVFGGGRSNYYALQVHKITDKSRAGLESFDSVCDKVANYLSNAILVGHNILACDIKIISEAVEKKGYKIDNYKLVDTQRLAMNILESGNAKLEDCCREFGITFGEHDALGDAISCLLLLEELVKIKKEEPPEFFFVGG